MGILLVVVVIAILFFLLARAAFNDGEIGAAAAGTLLGILLIICAVDASRGYFGELKNLDGDTFVVEAKVVNYTGKNVYLLYDLKKKNNRVASMETYPPMGYQETTTMDGKILLTPIPGK